MEFWIYEKNGHKRAAKEVSCKKCAKKWLIRKDKSQKGLCRGCWQIDKNEKFLIYKGLNYRAKSQKCSDCKKEYLIISSSKNRNRCKDCHMSYVHKMKEGTVPYNKGKHNPLSKSYSKEYISKKAADLLKERRREIIRIKGNKCAKCQLKNIPIAAYELHHRDPSEKDKKSMRGSLVKMLKEAEKCDLVCANCHNIIHSPFGGETLE